MQTKVLVCSRNFYHDAIAQDCHAQTMNQDQFFFFRIVKVKICVSLCISVQVP